MLYEPFFNTFRGLEYNQLNGLQIYNETRYGFLNNLDYRNDIGTFKDKAHSVSVNTLSLDPIENRYLLSGSSDSSIKLWDIKSTITEKSDDGEKYLIYKPAVKIPRKSVHDYGITKVKWWPDNGMWLSSSFDFKMNLYDTTSMNVVHTFNLGSRIIDFTFHPLGNNSTVVCCLDGGVGGLKLLDLRTLSDTQNLGGGGIINGGVGYMSSCAWSPSNSYLCVGGGIEGSCYGWDIRSSDKYLFELNSNETIASLERKQMMNNIKNKRKDSKLKSKAHYGLINSILFNEVGTELITLGNDEKLKIWDLCSYNKPVNKAINFGPLIRNKNRQHIDMCISPSLETDISFLWVPSDSGELLVYRLEDGSLLARLNRANSDRMNGRSFSIVSSKNNQIRYYSGCKDGHISVWGYDDYKERPSLPVAFDNGIDVVNDINED
jgi:DNA excision repair protein ERCC-8